MKFLGTVNKETNTVAKRTAEGTEIKKSFMINFKDSSSRYTGSEYGSLNIYVHGKQIKELGIGLDDPVDVYVVKSGEDYSGKITKKQC